MSEITNEKSIKAFYVFKKAGLRFLAVPNDNGIRVIDENGINYGGFFSIKSFMNFTLRGK